MRSAAFAIATLLCLNGNIAEAQVYAIKSFAPITQITTAPFLVMVHHSVPAPSLRELIKLAKAKPGQLNFGASNGGITHVAGKELAKWTAAVTASGARAD
jgi:tripartite-type tricarboxylate transporter receptor subunit TctC